MRTDSSNRQQSSTIDWLAHPRSSWRCLVPRLLPRLAEDALAEPRSFWPAVGLGWRSCCWRRVCCAESVWEGPATEVMVRAPPPRTEDQHLERSSPVGQAGRYGPGVLQGGRSDRLRGECAAIRVLFGGEEALPTPAGPKRQAVRSHTQHTPSQMATAACFDNGNARLCTRPGPSRFAQCVRPPRPAAAHLQICWPGPHHTYALSNCRQLSSVVSWLQVRAPCSSSRPLIRALFARLRPLPGRAPPPTSLW